jgi:hypothetical protein
MAIIDFQFLVFSTGRAPADFANKIATKLQRSKSYRGQCLELPVERGLQPASTHNLQVDAEAA